MAQPTPYTRYTNFTTQSPPSGPDLEVEFNRIKTTTDETRVNLSRIQRDDGGLHNGIVTPDTLSAGSLTLMGDWTLRGAWVTARNYAYKDVVTTGGASYVCASAHTSGTFLTDVAAGRWMALASSLSTVVTPEAFGAAGDGVTDDSTAFTNAIANAAGRPLMLDPAKTYAIKDVSIALSSTCPGVFSVGGMARLVPPPSYTNSNGFFYVYKTSDVFFRNIFFDMPASTSSSYGYNAAIRFNPTTNYDGTRYFVEDCRFSGGNNHIVGVGYIIRNSRFARNYHTNSCGDAISVNAVLNVEIVDNIFEDTSIGEGGYSGSGVIRTGTYTQREGTLNLTISRNHFVRCSPVERQSSIDCFSGSARNIRIEDNIIENCGGTIELKTYPWAPASPSVPTLPETYSNLVVANNTIRVDGTVYSSGGITVFHAGGSNAAGKCRDVQITGNKILCDPAWTSTLLSYAIVVDGYDDVTISDNVLKGWGHGIAVSGAGGGGGTNTGKNYTISGNTIDVVEAAIQIGVGTITGLYINDNPLIRISASGTGNIGPLAGGYVNDLEISGNRIETLASSRDGINLFGVTGGKIFWNTIIAPRYGIYTYTTSCTGVDIVDNTIYSSTTYAIRLDIGTGWVVQGNRCFVPAAGASVMGSGTYMAAGNIRGIISTDPNTAYAGTVGDIFEKSAPASGGYRQWVCTTGGNAAAAVWKGTGTIA